MEPDGDSPPIWSPPTTLFIPVRRRRPSPILNPVAVIVGIPILILLVIFFVVPPFLSHTNQILRQFSSVKKGWDSLNIVLVLFAIFCGVFARRNDENSSSDDADADHDQQNVDTVSNVSDLVSRGRDSVLSYNWLDFPDRKEYNKMSVSVNSGGSRLMRSSSSYPDLRQESLWESDGNRFKFFDDSEVNFHRTTENFYSQGRRSHKVEKEAAETATEIPVDKYLVTPVPPSPTHQNSQAPFPPPPPPPPQEKRKRSVHSVPQKAKVERERNEEEFNEKGSAAPPTPPPPPPPPPGPEFYPLAERREKIQRKKSGTTKEIATAISSLYLGSHAKRKNKVKTRDIYENATQNSSPPSVIVPPSTPPPPPPPPPPTPPSKGLQNLFKKSSKSKRVHSVPTAAPPPPPPPPPPNSIFNNIFKTASKSKRFQLSSASSQPPPPPPPPPSSILNSLFKNGSKSRRFQNLDNPPLPPPPPTPPETRRRHRTVNDGKPPKPTKPSTSYHESTILAPPSPLIPMPPPPPPPPFRMPEMKFVAKGDFVRIRSANSSSCSSPELEDVDVASVKSDGGDSVGAPMSCPSPDVNTKADTFISRLKDEWRLEKMNSMKEKRQSGSLSTRPGPHA